MKLMQNSYGYTVTLTTNLDLTTATVIRVRLTAPTASGLGVLDKHLTHNDVTSAATGIVTLPINPGDLPVPGYYRLEAFDETPGRRVISTVGQVEVDATLDTDSSDTSAWVSTPDIPLPGVVTDHAMGLTVAGNVDAASFTIGGHALVLYPDVTADGLTPGGLALQGGIEADTTAVIITEQPLSDAPHNIYADGTHGDTNLFIPFTTGAVGPDLVAIQIRMARQHSTIVPFGPTVAANILPDVGGVPDPNTEIASLFGGQNFFVLNDATEVITLANLASGDLGYDTVFDHGNVMGSTPLDPLAPYWLQLSFSDANDADGVLPTALLDGHSANTGVISTDDTALLTNVLPWTPYLRILAAQTPAFSTPADTPVPVAVQIASPGAGFTVNTKAGSAFMGHSRYSVAIWGASEFDAGIQGESTYDNGVLGIANGPNATGGYFTNTDPTGPALQAQRGTAQFDSVALTIVTTVQDYEVDLNVSIVVVNASGKTITLRAANAAGILPGRLYIVKNGAAGSSTTVASAGGTIDGATTKTLASAFDVLRVFSDGTNWLVI